MRNNNKTKENLSGGSTVPEFFAGLYYRYGLLVASHPSIFIFIAIATIISLGTPLIYLPLPVYVPQEYTTALQNYSIPTASAGIQLSFNSDASPVWYNGPPRAYIQQIIVRSTVLPWRKGITVGESIRGPLFTVFHVSQLVSDFQMKDNASITLLSECLLVEEVIRKMKSSVASLPNYNCLMLSPADIWGRDPQAFVDDKNVLFTVNSLKGKYDGVAGIADILFGLPYKDVGIQATPNHPQIINYAITLVLKQYSAQFIDNLEEELTSRFPLQQPVSQKRQKITHMYFPSQLSIWEFLIATFYCFLFSSIYFFVLKMKGLYSKLGLAVSVISTLISSLGIATSITAHLGVRPLYTQYNFIHAIMAGLIGFENSVALIRSILSTPDHLDIKIRVAQGLAREGWTITKYWLTMITIVTLSFFLFIPFVQEFCIYGSLVLLCDLYMQMVFLMAVISTDMKRYQESDEHKGNRINLQPRYTQPSSTRLINQTMADGTYVPNLHRRYKNDSQGEDRLATPQSNPKSAEKMPRRLRLTYFMARKRLLQRIVMCFFVSWIAYVISSAEFVDQLTDKLNGNLRTKDLCAAISALTNRSCNFDQTQTQTAQVTKEEQIIKTTFPFNETKDNTESGFATGSLELLKHKYRSSAKRLPSSQWPALFSYYNISLRGKYLSILPPIMLSTAVSPGEARLASNIHDPHISPWKPELIKDSNSEEDKWKMESAIIPSSKGELIVTGFLVIPAAAFLMYALFTFYRIICSRNYAEWRSSWKMDESFKLEASQIVGEAVPLMMAGHPHDVECLCTDGSLVVSACLAGAIYVWDPMNGECISTINRNELNPVIRCTETIKDYKIIEGTPSKSKPTKCCSCNDEENLTKSSYSSPSLSNLPDLTPTINLEFGRYPPRESGSPFESVKKYYEEFNRKQMRQRKSVSCYECEYDKFGDNLHDEASYQIQSVYPYKSKGKHMRNLSAGNVPIGDINRHDGTFGAYPAKRNGLSRQESIFPSCPIWCLDCQDGLLYVGTGSGIIEIWDGLTGKLECVFNDGSLVGVTSLKVFGNRVVAARLVGSVDVLQLEARSRNETSNFLPDHNLRLVRKGLVKAHQQPITVLCCNATRIITGSHDHTLKILNIIDGTILFNLHGHYGPVTTIALGGPSYDDGNNGGIVVDLVGVSSVVASGGRDGSLCVWDIQSGTCVYSVQAHDGGISALVCTSSYILSLGEDDRLCVWERFQGHLLNTLVMNHMYSSSMVMLSNRLLITSRQGSLTVWDITEGVPVRVVRLGDHDNSVFVRHLLPVGGSVVCDYGNQLRVVRFPVAEKLE